MNTKTIILAIFCFLAAVLFITAGIYFLSQKFIEKLNEASPDKSPEALKKNSSRAKGSAYISLGIGGLSLALGAISLSFPQAAPVMALTYMILLMIAVFALIFVYK